MLVVSTRDLCSQYRVQSADAHTTVSCSICAVDSCWSTEPSIYDSNRIFRGRDGLAGGDGVSISTGLLSLMAGRQAGRQDEGGMVVVVEREGGLGQSCLFGPYCSHRSLRPTTRLSRLLYWTGIDKAVQQVRVPADHP